MLLLLFAVVVSFHATISASESTSRAWKTSEQMAAIRAIASESNTTHFSEPLARILAGRQQESTTNKGSQRNHVRPHIGRHMIIDQMLYNAIIGRCHAPKQVVILGAGMDTRAYRLIALGLDVQWYELDLLETIQVKEERLQQHGVDLTGQGRIHRLAMDVQEEDFLPRLQELGYDPNAPTVFIMEGFLYYLPKESVQALLDQLPTLPTNRIIVSIMKAQTRRYFNQLGQLANKSGNYKELWQCDLQELRRHSIFPPRNWRILQKVETNTRGAKKLQLGIKIPLLDFPKSIQCPPECIFELMA